MAGEQADDVPGALINHHHRRVAELVIHQRGQHPHGNPGGADKNQRREAAERLAGSAGKAAVEGDKPLFLQRFAGVTGKRQHGRQPFCQPHAAGRQAKQGNGFRLYGIHG
ncbi:hypothetical protein KPZU09_66580 [Klebsiella pneumoniae]|jgi:hypothetical protein|uniref:Uncharacterized protein n=1 Tax=Klebsiella pneumoniae TaxID=573 RepID=A0A919M2R1_KLEPN|nr:hypothetical protein KPZU09_66580 [Klebsiella pneumoniae]SSL80655.1 Uncharacterised protein [Klebsiella pneumoniae]